MRLNRPCKPLSITLQGKTYGKFIVAEAQHRYRDIASQVQTLIEVANGIWKTNLQLVAFLSKFPAATPAPDLRYTWVQAPVKLEDAFGRVLPVPSEYNWGVGPRPPPVRYISFIAHV